MSVSATYALQEPGDEFSIDRKLWHDLTNAQTLRDSRIAYHGGERAAFAEIRERHARRRQARAAGWDGYDSYTDEDVDEGLFGWGGYSSSSGSEGSGSDSD